MAIENIYSNGSYLKNNPTWDAEDSKWKAIKVADIITRNHLEPHSICDVGCGAGYVLHELSNILTTSSCYIGYDISPQAINLCPKNNHVQYRCGDIMNEKLYFDLILAIDVFEHISDYINFLEKIKNKSCYKIFHIPLDISVSTVFRSKPILSARNNVGHLHYFYKDMALRILEDLGYEIVDWRYTCGAIELPAKRNNRNIFQTLGTGCLKLPRKLLFSINKDFCVRLLGGFSLLVLAK